MVEGLKTALETVVYENLTNEVINDNLRSVTGFETGGLTPTITMDPEYPVYLPGVRIGRIEGGSIKPVSDWYEYPNVVRW